MKTNIQTTETQTNNSNVQTNQPAFWLNGKNKVKFGRLAIDNAWRPHFDKFTGGFMFIRQADLELEVAPNPDKNGHEIIIAKYNGTVIGRIFQCSKSKAVLAKAFKTKSVAFNKMTQVVKDDVAEDFFEVPGNE